MDDVKLQQHITDWLLKYHAPSAHRNILEHGSTIGSKSKPWTTAIQRYVKGITMQEPRKAEIKRACRTLLETRQQEKAE